MKKQQERFERAMKTLIQAFFNDTLAKGDCCKCAVGNICGGSAWRHVFATEHACLPQKFDMSKYNGDAKIQIESTGYSAEELARMESAFEKNTKLDGSCFGVYPTSHFTRPELRTTKEAIMQDQFNGLMAVVEVLCEIEGLDCEPYKKAFEYTQDFSPVNN